MEQYLIIGLILGLATISFAQSDIQANALTGLPYYDEVLGYRVYRPCPDLDIDCIRDYFAANGHCTRASGSIPNPLYQLVSNYYFPSVNASCTQFGNANIGLNGTVNNFYINPATGFTVFSVAYDKMKIVTEADRFLYHLNGMEPVRGKISSIISFPEFQITTIFKGNHLDLVNSYSVGFLSEIPGLELYNPAEDEVQDPLFRYMLTQLRSNFITFVKESYTTRVQFFTAAFIQYSICDYGINLNQPSYLPGTV